MNLTPEQEEKIMKINYKTSEIEFYDKDGLFITSISVYSTRLGAEALISRIESIENDLEAIKEKLPNTYRQTIMLLKQDLSRFLKAWDDVKSLFLTNCYQEIYKNDIDRINREYMDKWFDNYKNRLDTYSHYKSLPFNKKKKYKY